MDNKSKKNLNTLLSVFNAKSLGNGDINAGANRLVATACALANIARPGTSIYGKSNIRYPIHCNLLISGSLSSAIISDSLIAQLSLLQNNYTNNLRVYYTDKTNKPEDTKLPLGRTNQFTPRSGDPAQSSLHSILGNEEFIFESGETLWANVLTKHSNYNLEELAMHPKVVITALDVSSHKQHLTGLHLSSALMVGSLSESKMTKAICESYISLCEGKYSTAVNGEILRASLMFNDPLNELGTFLKDSSLCTSWLNHLIWLVDGEAGPENEHAPCDKKIINISQIFEHTIVREFSKRLNNEGSYIKVDIDSAQEQWISFLKEREETLPGIIGSAKNLLASLAYGIGKMREADKNAVPPYHIDHIQALAQFVIYRMSNAHAAMQQNRSNQQLQRHETRILECLSERPHNVRELSRRINRLRSEPCNELLHSLEKRGLIHQIDNYWELTAQTTPQPITLEI